MDDETTIKDLWRAIGAESSISYNAFLEKFNRLKDGNVRTTNGVLRKLGLATPPRVRAPRTGPRTGPRTPSKPYHPKSTFVSYDGEGWDDKYVLLANSLGERVVNQDGLSTVQCLELLAVKYDQVVKRVFFSFSYDVNHILRDVPDSDIEVLLRGRSIVYEGYRISYIPGKILTINGYKYYDVFSFFARSFLRVVELMLGKDAVSESLVEGKSGRGSFEKWDLDKIISYNDEELRLLVEICEKLETAFENIGVYLTQWYGPGAVAKYWFKEHDVLPKEKHTFGSIEAVNSAYYGGRFEQLSLGRIRNVWEYDIHSAYPSVMAGMPHFRSFRRTKKFEDNVHSLWYISFDLRGGYPLTPTFMPLPVRSKDGHICFPMVGKGWYWYEEVKVMLDFFPKAQVTFHDGYVAKIEGKPFSWINELYDYRQSLKDSGNLSQYAIKVGLNSLYGKTAQRVGNNQFFSLAWAGFITSSTRAKLARAGYESGSAHVIGFATDAIFSDRKFKLRLSDNLGDWEESRYAEAIFFQSGVYRLSNSNGTYDDRYRGSPLRKGIDAIIAQLVEHPYSNPEVRIVRFISHMLAIKAPRVYGPLRLQFVQVKQELQLDAPYKRHYLDFTEGIHADGTRVQNFGRLLTQKITSNPKVIVEDNQWQFSWFLFDGTIPLHNIESNPPPMKDGNSQRMLEEAELLALEEGFDEVSTKLEILPIVEDTMS